MRLNTELIPSTAWGNNLRSYLTKAQWDQLRRWCYKQASYKCEICGGLGSTHPVECHESWEYDDDNHVLILVGVMALCPKCHTVKHIGRAYSVGEGNRSLRWMAKVNGWSMAQVRDHLDFVFEEWTARNYHVWTVDLSWADRWFEEHA